VGFDPANTEVEDLIIEDGTVAVSYRAIREHFVLIKRCVVAGEILACLEKMGGLNCH